MSDDLVKRLTTAKNTALGVGALWNLCDNAADRIEALEAKNARLWEALLDTAANLSAAISLLEKGGRNAAWSDKVFLMLLSDYRRALKNARTTLKETDDE